MGREMGRGRGKDDAEHESVEGSTEVIRQRSKCGSIVEKQLEDNTPISRISD
jgi:hypothetical protein